MSLFNFALGGTYLFVLFLRYSLGLPFYFRTWVVLGIGLLLLKS